MRLVVGDLVRNAGFSGTYGGIRFEVAEGAGYIDTVHFMYDETAGFSALMKMFDHDPSAKLEERVWGGNTIWTTRAPMLALQEPDPALALPAGTRLQPRVLVRNTTSRVLVANVKLTWRGESRQGVLKLAALQLRPFETHLVDVGALQQSKQIPSDAHWALVEISSPGKPDDLMAIASSYDSTGRYGAQTPFSDQLADRWVGGEWQVDATHNTIIAVTNAGHSATEAVLTFHYNHGQDGYEIRRAIAAGDQLWLNLGDTIHGRVPDNQGRTFPPELTSGTYDLRETDRPDNPSLFEGKFIVDKTYGHLAYGCLHCCGYTATEMLANPEQLGVQVQDLLSVQAYDACFDDWTPQTGHFSGWDSGNHSVAMLSSNQITGMGVGSTDAFASGQLLNSGPPRHCPMHQYNPATPTNVRTVYQVEPLCINGNCTIDQGQDGTGGLDSCAQLTGFGRGWVRYVNDQLQFQDGSPVNVSGLVVADTINIATPNGLGVSGTETGQAITTGNGAWQDKYYVCTTACFGSSANAGATQSWTWNGIAVPPVNGAVYACSYITIDGK